MTTPTIPGEQVEQSPAPLETKVVTEEVQIKRNPGASLVPWNKETAAAAGRIGGLAKTQKKRDGARLAAIKRIAKQTGGISKQSHKFLINFLESGDTARAQVVSMAQDLHEQLKQCDPEKVGGAMARVQDVILKATEHQHGRAPIKVHSINLNFEANVNEADALDIIEAFSQ